MADNLHLGLQTGYFSFNLTDMQGLFPALAALPCEPVPSSWASVHYHQALPTEGASFFKLHFQRVSLLIKDYETNLPLLQLKSIHS